jgi:hypothetical protein
MTGKRHSLRTAGRSYIREFAGGHQLGGVNRPSLVPIEFTLRKANLEWFSLAASGFRWHPLYIFTFILSFVRCNRNQK